MRAIVLLAAVAVAGCGGDPKPSGSGGTAAAPAPPGASPDAGTPAAPAERVRPDTARKAPPPPTPKLALLVNGQGHDPKVVAGWPVVVRLDLVSSGGKPWKISGAGAPWSRLVRFEMTGGDAWPLEPAVEAPNEVTVDERTSAVLFWTIAPEISAKLPQGERTVVAVLETRDGGGGAWTGVARSRELRVAVVDEPNPLPPAWAERKAEVGIDYAFCHEGAGPALGRAEAAVKAQPASWRLLSVKGNLLAGLDRRTEAIAALDEAIALWWNENPKGCAPPWELVAQREASEPVVPPK